MANRYKVTEDSNHPYLVTCTIVNWWPVFISKEYCDILSNSFNFLSEKRGLRIHAYVFMPTHIHAIISSETDTIPNLMRDFKRFTSHSIIEKAKELSHKNLSKLFQKAGEFSGQNNGKVWQDEYHPKVISSGSMFEQKISYVHQNPVRKGLVYQDYDWVYSSASYYEKSNQGVVNIYYLEW